MNRGLSFVGKGIDPLTATVMFYKAGLNSHAVGMVQKFGRITGSARPDLYNRKIYCSQAAYEDYTGYIENQNAVYNALLDYPELNMTQILGLVVSRKLNRPVDRPVLKKVNKEYSQNSSSDSGVDMEDARVNYVKNVNSVNRDNACVIATCKDNKRTVLSKVPGHSAVSRFVSNSSFCKIP